MYAKHTPALRALCASGPGGYERIATFALCTIRMPLRDACLDYPLVRRDKPAHCIFGAKHAGLAYVRRNAADLWEASEQAYATLDDADAADVIVRTAMAIPSIGPAKAGFIAQMGYGLSGCIDTHNIARFGISPRVFQTGRKATDYRRISDYNQFCRQCGGTEALWDDWCQYVAQREPITYRESADYVSSLHLTPLEC